MSRVTIELDWPAEDIDRVAAAAKAEGISMDQFIHEALSHFLITHYQKQVADLQLRLLTVMGMAQGIADFCDSSVPKDEEDGEEVAEALNPPACSEDEPCEECKECVYGPDYCA
jgi:hypothetical protein